MFIKGKFFLRDFLIQFGNINYANILTTLKPIIVCYLANKTIGSYKLHRQYRPKNIKKVNIPPELKLEYSNQDIEVMTNSKFDYYLKNFSNVIMNNFSSNDLVNFHNHMNTLQTSHNDFKILNFILRCNVAGTYDVKNNKITVDENNCSTTIYHELFHMASSNYKDGIRYSGFRQASLKPGVANLGEGINEGYTELLRRRYFLEENHLSRSYEYEITVARNLEKIIDKSKMESLYMNANLPGLIQELKQFSTDKEIMKFISSTDFVFKHLDNRKMNFLKKKMVYDSLKYINKFLIKVYCQKLFQQLNDKIISSEEFFNNLSVFIYSLNSELEIGGNEYEILSKKDIGDCLKYIVEKNASSELKESAFIAKK